MSEAVIWHDVECGGYEADLQLWRDLAAEARGPVLDVGAGTGRVALDLARRGHEVVAIDVNADLLAALDARAAGVPVETVRADARDFELGRGFALVIVPMQTVQLLPGEPAREAFLSRVRAHLTAGGRLAMALADPLDGYDERHDTPPVPDLREIDGVIYASRPVRLVDAGARIAIEREREVVDAAGLRRVTEDVIWLEHLSADQMERECETAGLRVLPRVHVPATDVYVGSAVVMAGA